MSEVIEPTKDIDEASVSLIHVVEDVNEDNVKVEEQKVEEEKEEEQKEDVIIEEKDINVKPEEIKTFLQLFETFLTQDQSNLAKFDLKLTPEIQKYFLLLCKESPDLFGTLEETLKKIISDNRINTKDIPDILVLVSKVYKIINENKGIPTADPYDLIKSLLHITLVVYIETNKIENPELLLELLKIVESSIDLIKLTPIISKKGWLCFKCK
jgi:hypothetical protein